MKKFDKVAPAANTVKELIGKDIQTYVESFFSRSDSARSRPDDHLVRAHGFFHAYQDTRCRAAHHNLLR